MNQSLLLRFNRPHQRLGSRFKRPRPDPSHDSRGFNNIVSYYIVLFFFSQCLVLGAGPCGLRTAIELSLLGAQVVVLEKRESFSRNNVLHLWPYTIYDLRALGAKKFYGKFCTGSLDHISEWLMTLLNRPFTMNQVLDCSEILPLVLKWSTQRWTEINLQQIMSSAASNWGLFPKGLPLDL